MKLSYAKKEEIYKIKQSEAELKETEVNWAKSN